MTESNPATTVHVGLDVHGASIRLAAISADELLDERTLPNDPEAVARAVSRWPRVRCCFPTVPSHAVPTGEYQSDPASLPRDIRCLSPRRAPPNRAGPLDTQLHMRASAYAARRRRYWRPAGGACARPDCAACWAAARRRLACSACSRCLTPAWISRWVFCSSASTSMSFSDDAIEISRS